MTVPVGYWLEGEGENEAQRLRPVLGSWREAFAVERDQHDVLPGGAKDVAGAPVTGSSIQMRSPGSASMRVPKIEALVASR